MKGVDHPGLEEAFGAAAGHHKTAPFGFFSFVHFSPWILLRISRILYN